MSQNHMISKLTVSCEDPCQKTVFSNLFYGAQMIFLLHFPSISSFYPIPPWESLLLTRDEIPVFNQFMPGKFPFPGKKFPKFMLLTAQLPGHFVFPWGGKLKTHAFP